MYRSPLALALAAALLAATARAETVVLQPSSQDAFVQKDKPNRIAGAGPSNTRIRVEASPPNTQTRRGLVQFDLSPIPTGSAVSSAILEVYEGNNPDEAITHGAHRLNAPWLQSTVKWNNQPTHQAVPTATTVVPADTVREFRSFDVTADVQAFVNLCTNNNGWMIRDQAETATNEDVNYIAKEENAIPDQPNRPKLTVQFTRPPCDDDTDCADGNFCTTNEHCVDDVCVVDPVICDDTDPCTDDICDCTSGCIFSPICNDGFSCTTDSCNPTTLACTNTKVDAACTTQCSSGVCVADPDSNAVDQVTGCVTTSTLPNSTPCDDGDPCTGNDVCGGGACGGAPAVCDHYVAYKAKASKIDPIPNKFPRNFNVSLDDVLFDNAPPEAFPDDPENYRVKKERDIVNPAMKNDEPGPFRTDLHYIRYQIGEAKEGIGPADPLTGNFPRPPKAPKRLWEVTNQFGNLFIETKKVTALWVPAGKALAPGLAPDAPDGTHYVCYQAKASKIPSAQAPDKGNGVGKFRKDIQHYFADQFEDCRFLKDGVTVAFDGTAVEGKCLFDLKKPKEICNPVDKTAVVPPRETSAQIDGSTAAVREESILCYQAKLSTKMASSSASALGGIAVGQKVKQTKHAKRQAKFGTQVNTTPGNGFPTPVAMDTTKAEFVCVPTTVLSVSDL